MYASEFIDDFVNNTNVTVDREFLRRKTNYAQNKILGVDNTITRVLPDPFFVTEQDVYSYVANESFRIADGDAVGAVVTNIRSIRRIYTREYTGNMGLGYNFGMWARLTPLRYQTDDLGGFLEAPIDAPDSRKALANDCIVSWNPQYQPGISETVWRGRVYRWPTQILTQDVEIEIPDDFIDDLLFHTVRGMIEDNSYGRQDYSLAMAAEAQKRFNTKYSVPTIYQRPRNSPAINA